MKGLLNTVCIAGVVFFSFISPAQEIFHSSGARRHQWFVYYMAGAPAGKAYVEEEKSADARTITAVSTLRMNVYGEVKSIEMQVFLRKRKNNFELEAQINADVPFTVTARKKGKVLLVEFNGEERKYKVPDDMELYTSYDIEDLLDEMLRAKRKTAEVLIFDPFIGKPVRAKIKYTGEAQELLEGHVCRGRRYELFMMGLNSIMYYVSERHTVVCEKDASGMVSIAVESEPQLGNGQELPDIIQKFSVHYKGPDPRKFKVMMYKLQGIDIAELNITGFRQTLKNGWLEVSVEDIPPVSYIPPYRGSKYTLYLGKSDLIDPESKELKKVLRELNVRGKSAIEVFRSVIYWVYTNLKKEAVVSIPSPEEILKTRRGDCNEHAVLAVALLRAAGVPSRVAVGLVYMDGRFYYHAWVEAYTGKWISGDPVMGQIPADASHIRFAAGDLENWLAIYRLLGRIKIRGMAGS